MVALMSPPTTLRALLVDNCVHRQLRRTGVQNPATPQNSKEVYLPGTVALAMNLLRKASKMDDAELQQQGKQSRGRGYTSAAGKVT